MSSLHTPLNIASLSREPSPALVSQAFEPSTQNYGFFPGASNIEANNGVFSQVAGDQNNTYINATSIEVEENAFLDKLPRAISAGYSSRHHRTCLEGTRTEVLKEIETWEIEDFESFVYWLKGVAGCGKSTIAQTFAELSAARGRLGASFFCSRDFPDRRNVHLIIPTLARALALRFPEFKTALVQILRSYPTDIAEDSLDIQFEKLIVEPLKVTGLSTTIVVDALDECEDTEPVSTFLSVLARHLGDIPNVKFFITGRPEDHVRSGFENPSLRTRELPLHDVDRSTVDSDIRSFVRSELNAIATRNPRSVAGTWPSEDDIEAVTMKASGHFIVASIILKFVDDRHSMPQERLDLILSVLNSTILEGRSGIDRTYVSVLTSSFNDVNTNASTFFEELRIVLACIVLPFHPLSRASIARMLGMSPGQIWAILRTLHSVLIVSDSDSEPIRICHKSFADFLTDSSRCLDQRFHIKDSAHHLKLGVLCLKLMDTKLKSNICGLPRYIMNKDVTDSDARREKYIGSTLAYACGYWAKHLQMSTGASDDGGVVVKQVDQFFRKHFLSWLEVLSIEANLRAAVYSLRGVISWMQLLDVMGPQIVRVESTRKEWLSRSQRKTTSIPSQVSNLLDLIDDYERFVLHFFEPMEVSAMHILHSALIWSPKSSLVRRVYEGKLVVEARVVKGLDIAWSPFIKMIPLDDSVHKMVFSHQGTLIAVVGRHRMKIFDTVTGACLAIFDVDEHISDADFSHDDNFLTYGQLDWTVRVFDVQTGNHIHRFQGHAGYVCSVAFSPSGTMIASGGVDKTIRIWNVSSGSCECCLEDHSDKVWAVCWSGTGKHVISGSGDGSVRIWDVSTRTCSRIIEEHTNMLSSVASFRNLVASGDRDGIIKIYNSKSDRVSQTISTGASICSVRFSTDGDKLLYVHRDSASICDVAEKRRVWTTFCDGPSAALSPDGMHIALVDGNSLKISKTGSGNLDSQGVQDDSMMPINAVLFSPDGQLVASGSRTRMKIWDTNSGQFLAQFRLDSLRKTELRNSCIQFSPNSEFVTLGIRTDHWSSWEWTVWNVRTLRRVNKITCNGGIIALSSDGARMASISSAGISLWSLKTGKRISRLELDYARKIQKISFDSDGFSILVTTRYGRTKGWRICPASLPNSRNSLNNESAPPPMILVPKQEGWSHPRTTAPSSRCLYYKNGDEWILDSDGIRLLWVPPERRDVTSIDVQGNKIAVGTKGGRMYMVDFSNTLSHLDRIPSRRIHKPFARSFIFHPHLSFLYTHAILSQPLSP